MSREPISLGEVTERKRLGLPAFVLDVFDELLVRNWNGSCSRVLQAEALKMIRERMAEGDARDPFAEHWMDVEPLYRAVGWTVKYDKPGYNEDYPAYYIFSK